MLKITFALGCRIQCMKPEDLRQRILSTRNPTNDSDRQLHFTANYLNQLLGFINFRTLGTYGETLKCSDIVELSEAANSLKIILIEELGDMSDKYFRD